jgi:hypothetical protein
VDGADQSVAGGPFLWTSKARTTVRGIDLDGGLVDAEHDGYQRFEEPVQHRRWLIAPPEETTILVVDQLSGSGRHEFRTGWPLHPELEVLPASDGAGGHLVTRAGEPVLHVAHAATAACEPIQVRADEGGLGWWSERLESRRPGWLIGVSARAEAPVVLVTALQVACAAERPAGLAVRLAGDLITVSWHEGPRRLSVDVDAARPAAIDWAIAAIDESAQTGGGV